MKIDRSMSPTPSYTAATVPVGGVIDSGKNGSVLMRVSLPATMNELANGRIPYITVGDGQLLWLDRGSQVEYLPNATILLHGR